MLLSNSREAAKEYSPRRKPWENVAPGWIHDLRSDGSIRYEKS